MLKTRHPNGRETDLVWSILRALKPIFWLRAWRNNTGRRGRVQFGLGTGSADIVGILGPKGRFFAIECKTTTLLTDEQKEWLAHVERLGGLVIVANTLADALEGLGVTRKEPHEERASEGRGPAAGDAGSQPNSTTPATFVVR
jgi:hypothetical protein